MLLFFYFTGSNHNFRDLNGMVITVTGKLNNSKSELIEKEEQLQDYYNKMSDVEPEVLEMVDRVHRQREEQVNILLCQH